MEGSAPGRAGTRHGQKHKQPLHIVYARNHCANCRIPLRVTEAEQRTDFKTTAQAALADADAVLAHWLPDGKHEGHEYTPLNPTRSNSKPGSFSINNNTDQWADYAGSVITASADLLILSWRLII